MSKKKILSVEIELASDDVKYCEFDSDTSLLDWTLFFLDWTSPIPRTRG
jgi:hypothetical protein